MKKTLLAAALVTGFAGSAMAQNSVTLYGVVDVGLRFQHINSGSEFPALGSVSQFGAPAGQRLASRWGLRGVEDLGNGLKANFVLESAINAADGASTGFTRQSTIGLSSTSWGAIDLGRAASAGTSQIGGIDPMILGYGTGSANSTLGIAFIRYNNQIRYQTPSISGFSAAVGYSFDTGLSSNATASATPFNNFASNNKGRAISAGVRYANGPIVLAGAYEGVQAADNAQAFAGNRINAFLVMGNYDFKVAKVFAAYAHSNGGFLQGSRTLNTAGATGGGDTNSASAAFFRPGLTVNSWMVGLTAPVGPGLLRASYQQRNVSGDLGNLNATTTMIPSVAYEYSLSNRTVAYVYYSYEKGISNIKGSSSNTVGLGVSHQF